MTIKAGLMAVDFLLLALLAYRVAHLKRRVTEYRPERTVRFELPATILTRVS